MKTKSLYAVLATILIFTTSCEVIGGIFKAGVWVGIIAVVAVIGIVVAIIGKAGKN